MDATLHLNRFEFPLPQDALNSLSSVEIDSIVLEGKLYMLKVYRWTTYDKTHVS